MDMKDGRDSLTNLLGLAAFLTHLKTLVSGGEPVILVTLDLDRFLAINERYGHAGGDQVIRTAADLFARAFAGHGVLAGRSGGDEFMAILPGNNLSAAAQQADALRRQVEADGVTVEGEGTHSTIALTVSIGLAVTTNGASDAQELIQNSRHALMQAKVAGGNRVMLFQETDPLTGLLNQAASQRALDTELRQARQRGEPVSVFLLDIDYFAEINERWGHRAGDDVLKRLGHILETNFPQAGRGELAGRGIGRTAGDEFLVILPGLRADSAFILAEEVRRLVEDSPIPLPEGAGSSSLNFHISGGVATFPGDGAEWMELLRKAGEALYRSKQTGRNRISLPAAAQMVTKTSYYTQVQLERLGALARKQDKTEAFLLREALDELLRKYGEGGD
jgi:diguanylate cyclase (GGDEF)-like protein